MISTRIVNGTSALIPVTFVALLAGAHVPAWAATLIVDQAGSSAYTQVGQAILAASDGDEIHVLAGLYQGAISLTKNLTLSCEGPDLVTLRNPAGDTITVEANKKVTITGCTVSGGGHGIGFRGGVSATITNNLIVANGSHGIYDITCTVDSVAIVGNTIAYNNGDGVNFYRCGGGTAVNANSLTLSNNIIANNAQCGTNLWGIGNGGAHFLYNDLFSNIGGSYCGAVYAAPTDVALNPSFVSQPTGDYRLASNSPCRNAGTPDSASLDPDGTRNDLGAFGGPGSAAFFQSPEMGPTIRSMSILPSSVPKGGMITLQATGRANAP